MWSTRKRKHDASPTSGDSPDDSLFRVRVYEADICCNPASARSLEANGLHIGEALIKHSTGESEIWVDRYDARLILDSLPTHPEERQPTSSPSGWSDLPSDTEATFFFGREEVEDYRRDKRRRLMESVREERLKALAQLESADEPQETCWVSDEEPDTAQKDLMQRTALHIQSSPNPAQLEMRILANHGADHRFAFLRGRWSKHWKAATDHARNEMLKRDEPAGLGGLAGYGSDDDSDVDNSK